MSSAKMIARAIGTFRIIVLAAILPQSQLGLYGMAFVVMQFIETMSQTGIRQALIQSPDEVDGSLGTAWVSQFVRGFAISLALVVSAGSVEIYFEKEGLQQLLLWLAILPIIQGFQNVGILHLHRELKFEKIVYLQLATAATDLIFSVIFSWYWPVAMSLVYGKLISVTIALVLSFLLESRRADLSFSYREFRKLYRFGFWIFVAALLSFTLVRGGDLVIGKLFDESELAVYQVAYAMACMPIAELMGVVSTTTFSAYSRIQNDSARLGAAFLRVLSLCSFVAIYSIVGSIVLGADFTKLFFNEEYSLVASLLPYLAIWGACRALGATNTSLFQAAGRPALATIFQVLMLVLFVVLLVPMARAHGLTGVAIALALIGVSAQLFRYFLIPFIVDIRGSAIFWRVVTPLVSGVLAAVLAMGVMKFIPEEQHLLRLIVGLIVISVVYLLGSIAIDMKLKFGVTDFMKSNLNHRLGRFVKAKGS